MKKVVCLASLLLALIGCNLNDNSQQYSSDKSINIDEKVTHRQVSTKDVAPEIAQVFVKKNFANDCKFEPDVVLENTMVEDRFSVMQKFKSNKQGVEQTYVYKIYVQYFEGDVSNDYSWEFSQLVVEEEDNGKQTFFKGNLDTRIKQSAGIGSTIEFAGVDFKIIDVRLGTSISFSHKGKLSREKLVDALTEMHNTYKYNIYHIYHDDNLNEDYFSWQATGNLSAVYDFENDKVYVTLDDYLNGKAAM